MRIQERINIHRFHDTVAISFESFDDTETLYLTPQMAQNLARELNRYAEDCESVRFSDSKLIGTNIATPTTGHPLGQTPSFE